MKRCCLSIVENTEAGYFFIDAAGVIRDVNPAWVRLYKYASAEEIVGQHFTAIQKLDDVEAAQECVAGIIRHDPRYFTGEFSRKCKDGSIGYHSFSARPVVRQGEVVGIEGFIIDTTNRRLTEDALRTSEKQSKAIIMAALWGMHFYRLEADGQLIFTGANPAADTILGVEHRAFIGKTIEEAFPGLIHTDIPDRYRMIARGGITWHIEQSQYEHGSIHGVFEVTAFQTLPDHMAASFLDITTRKRAEEEIRTLNAELETRVRRRTAELEVANRELKDFAYSVSHDLKAPLRAISRIATWLVEDYAAAFDDRGQELVKMLIGRVQRMDELIEGILEYSRIGRVHGERLPIDLTRLVYKIIDSLIPPAHIQIAINGPLPTITADKIRMTQVFQNLIGNAIKFMDKPRGEIRIACVDADDFWKFSVADTGPGIDLKYHEKIFQIFQTLRPRDEVESTGIGLSIVKKIVELYGGQITVESTVGEGSTFSFTWPKKETTSALPERLL